MLPVSAIIVSYNTRDLLRECLASLPDVAEIIVLDNNSTDGSPELVLSEFPHAVLIRNEDNRGFGAANNQGLRVATQPLALLINSDAVAHPGAVALLVDSLTEGRIAAGGKLVYPDGRFQLSASRALTLKIVFHEQTGLERVLKSYWIRSATPQAVGQVMGACLLMKRVSGAFLEFDENIFMYCEDTDLCHRLREHGEIWYETSAVFTHHLGGSSIEDRWKSILRYNQGKEYYFGKWFGPDAERTCYRYNCLGAWLRLVAYAPFWWYPWTLSKFYLWRKVVQLNRERGPGGHF